MPASGALPAASNWRVALVAWALSLGCAATPQAQAQNDGSPAPSLWTRDTLGGDWGGLRGALGQHGIGFNFWATGFYQDLLKGAGNDDGGFSGRADLLLNADTGKLGLWPGGGFHVHATYRGGDLPGSRGGALLPEHTSGLLPLGGKDEVVATSLYLSQRFGDATRLMLGKINVIDLLASHPFFGGWGTDRFWHLAFVAPPSGVVPPVIMGGVLSHSFAPYALTAMVFDPNDQTTNYSFNRLFDDGVNVSLGLSWSGEFAQRKSGAGLTATYSTAEGTDWSQIGLPPGSQTSTKAGSYNVAVELSHLLVESAVVRGKGLGVYAKAAVADGNPNPIKRSFVGGLAGHAIVPGRPLDTFGVGYFFYDFSDELQDAVAPVGSFKDEQGIEAFYAFVPAPWLRLSAHLQWVNPANGANPSVWLGGVRMRVAF
ncbi:MAG: carbohydrate porin [Burkholderiales bacterium]|nr:carbohydrate porin [Burkholderiales bacterium]